MKMLEHQDPAGSEMVHFCAFGWVNQDISFLALSFCHLRLSLLTTGTSITYEPRAWPTVPQRRVSGQSRDCPKPSPAQMPPWFPAPLGPGAPGPHALAPHTSAPASSYSSQDASHIPRAMLFPLPEVACFTSSPKPRVPPHNLMLTLGTRGTTGSSLVCTDSSKAPGVTSVLSPPFCPAEGALNQELDPWCSPPSSPGTCLSFPSWEAACGRQCQRGSPHLVGIL